ncbi:MAG TPA: glycosyltransferase [Burkholderiales bacterium]|nr:glycosyltransferase [Burkholderiales bacterium]
MKAPASPVAFLVKTFPKLSETFILEEILGLERLGLDLHVYALQRPTDSIQHEAVANVRALVSYLRPHRQVWLHDLICHLSLALTHPVRYAKGFALALRREEPGRWADFSLACALAKQLIRRRSTHLHAHFVSQPGAVAELAAGLCGIGYSISAHAKDIYTSSARVLERKLNGARFTVTCTRHNQQYLRSHAPSARQVHAMYHGIDAERFRPLPDPARPGRPLILSVGRLRAKKGFGTLIAACALLRERGIAFDCEIVGYGEEQPNLAASIDAAHIGDRVRLVGTMNHTALVQRYAAAAIFAAPSQISADGDRDGIPNVMLEAMAMELPVVASRVSGIPEVIVDGVNGRLVEPGSATALADALSELLSSATLRERLGRSARRTVIEHFDNDSNLRLLHGLLRQAIDQPQALHRGEKAYA